MIKLGASADALHNELGFVLANDLFHALSPVSPSLDAPKWGFLAYLLGKDAVHRPSPQHLSKAHAMIAIDTHQHFWRYDPTHLPWIDATMAKLKGDRLPEHVLAPMTKCGVSAALAVQAQSRPEETDALLAFAAEAPQICGVVGWTDLSSPHLTVALEAWSGNRKLKGFRHILQDERDVAALTGSTAFNAGLRLLQSKKLTYDVLVFERQLPEALALCARHDQHWLVLDHLGKPTLNVTHTLKTSELSAWLKHIKALAKLPHVVCKLSGLVTETDWQNTPMSQTKQENMRRCFDEALEAFGPDRIMFGSDWPVCTLAAPYTDVATFAQTWASAQLSPSEQRRFWSGTAERTYDLRLKQLKESIDGSATS